MPDYYVYFHRKKTDGSVFYIGKGTNKRAFSTAKRNPHWYRTVAKHGYTVEIVQSGMQEWWAFEMECDLIDSYGLKNLTNMTEGGKGGSPSEEVRAKLRAKHLGKKISDDVKMKLRAANIGKKHSDATKAKIGAAHLGKKKSPESVEKTRLAHTGKKRSKEFVDSMRLRRASHETKEKLRRAALGTKQSPETIAKRVLHLKGRVFSEDHKKKIGKSQKRTPVECSNGMVFESVMDAQRWLRLNGFPKAREGNVRSARDGRRNYAYGFTWKTPDDRS